MTGGKASKSKAELDRKIASLAGGRGAEHAAGGVIEVKPGLNVPGGKGLPRPAHDHILILDDKKEVVEDFLRACEGNEQNASFAFFWLTAAEGGQQQGFIEMVQEYAPWRCLYIDGDLNDAIDGLDLVNALRKKPALKYQPMAFLTQHESWLKDKADLPEDVPVLAKFDMSSDNVLKRLTYETDNLRRMARERLWHDVQSKVAEALARNKAPEKVARQASRFLQRYDGVKAWYYRELRDGCLQALAMQDAYGVDKKLAAKDLPGFLSDLIEDRKQPWVLREQLSLKECGTLEGKMAGDHCIAARLGGEGAAFQGLFTLYRDKTARPFGERDARELHHLALQINIARERQRMVQRQENLSERLGNILQAGNSRAACSCLQRFVHEELNQPRVLGGKTKTTVRLFARGTGDLMRWTQDGALGELGKGEDEAKRINFHKQGNKSTFVQAVADDKPYRNNDIIGNNVSFVATFKNDRLVSCLVAPLSFDGAVIGGINLEADYRNAYDKTDKRLLAALAKVTAASIMRTRGARFMEDMARLMAHAVRVDGTEAAHPEGLLDEAAQALYALTGYSNCILLSPPDDASWLATPWTVARAWRGAGENVATDKPAQLIEWKNKLRRQWNNSFLKKVLQAGRGIDFTNDRRQMSDDDKDLRPGRPTLAQLVIRIGTAQQPKGMLSLMFEHPRPVPKFFNVILKEFADFMTAIYEYRLQEVERLGERLAIERMEARIAKHFGNVRHAITGDLAVLVGQIDLDRMQKKPARKTLDKVRKGLQGLERKTRALARQALIKPPELQPCKPAEVWNALVAEFAELARQRQVTLHENTDDVEIQADPDILRSILFNLLDNALQHGRNMRNIRLHASPSGIGLCDDGEALPQETVDHMFEPGYTTSASGTGQGLYISHAFARDMGMELTFERKGAENCFCIHVKAPEGGEHG